MVTVCAWCQRYMGSREPLHDPGVSHGICDDCREREQTAPGGVILVVSRERAAEARVLQSLLRGIRGTTVVVDRRRAERRREHRGPSPSEGDRRTRGDRHRTALFVV
jgi:hypothetical protein